MHRSLEILYNEHEIIKSVIGYRDMLRILANSDPGKYKDILTELISFFRNYADKYHHYKEEKVLFPLMCEKNEMPESSIIEEMLDNHRDFRNLVKMIESCVIAENYNESHQQLLKYTEMLLDHIAVEDDELFQMAETLFDEDELEKLYFSFEDIDRELGFEIKNKFEQLNKKLELIF